jgi:hypothetical protein
VTKKIFATAWKDYRHPEERPFSPQLDQLFHRLQESFTNFAQLKMAVLDEYLK